MSTMTLEEINQDIHAMDEELWHYEARYGLRTPYFYQLYKAGKLSDEDPTEARDYSDWAGCYEIKQHREQLYDSMIRDTLEKAEVEQPISLASLNLNSLPTAA